MYLWRKQVTPQVCFKTGSGSTLEIYPPRVPFANCPPLAVGYGMGFRPLHNPACLRHGKARKEGLCLRGGERRTGGKGRELDDERGWVTSPPGPDPTPPPPLPCPRAGPPQRGAAAPVDAQPTPGRPRSPKPAAPPTTAPHSSLSFNRYGASGSRGDVSCSTMPLRAVDVGFYRGRPRGRATSSATPGATSGGSIYRNTGRNKASNSCQHVLVCELQGEATPGTRSDRRRGKPSGNPDLRRNRPPSARR